jgi:signal transduction histidine kinase
LLALGISPLIAQLHQACDVPACAGSANNQLSTEGVQVLQAMGISLDTYAALVVAVELVSALTWIGVASLVFWKASNEPMPLVAAFFLLTVGAMISSALLAAPSSVNTLWYWPSVVVRTVGDASLALFLFLFPTGRFVPAWTRWLVVAWVASQVPTELFPGSALDSNTWPTPLFLPLVGGFLITAIVVQLWRYRRRSGSAERQQTKSIVYGLAVALVGNTAVVALANWAGGDASRSGSALWLLAFIVARAMLLLIPLSVAVAVLRFRLWAVDTLLNRTLVYAALTAVVQSTREALKLPYAALTVRQAAGAELAAAAGTPTTETECIPLIYQQEMVGELMLAPRAPGESFGDADRRLLQDLARQAAVAAHAVRLSTDLQRSRERLVAAREEERRRLRRDLHDGLGPQLASQTLTIDAIRVHLLHDTSAADRLLVQLKEQSQGAVTEIRRLVYGLRPPSLDDLGLVEALREETAICTRAGLAVRLQLDSDLTPLPAAIEVAVFRIVQEALTNVVRHADATSVSIRIGRDSEQLSVEVTDDGRGVATDRRAGVGLTSMRERAEELGGDCHVDAAPGGGTRIVAHLPLTQLAAHEPSSA